MSNWFAAVQHERDPQVGARHRHVVDRRRVEGESLRVRIELPGAAQPRLHATLQLGDSARLRRAHRREAGEPVGMIALHGDQVIVDLGAERGVGERPAETHGAIDPGRIHRRQQLPGGDDRAVALMTRVKPRIQAAAK